MKHYLPLFLLLAGVQNCLAQSFERTYSNPSSVNFLEWTMSNTHDSGFVYCGKTAGTGFISKVDPLGNPQWTMTYSSTQNVWCVRETADSGYIALGQMGSNTALIKTNATGVVQWSRTLATVALNFVYVRELASGGYIAGGASTTPANGTILIRTDALGNDVWRKKYQLAGYPYGFSAFDETPDSGFVFCGNNSLGMNVVKTDSQGNVQWSKVYGSSGYDVYSIKTIDSSGYYIVGIGGTGVHILAKLDTSGNVSWARSWPMTSISSVSEFQYTVVDDDRRNATLYNTHYNTSTTSINHVLQVDTTGTVVWSRYYGITNDPNPGGLFAMEDAENGFAILADYNQGHGAYMMRIDSVGVNGCDDADAAFSFSALALPVTTGSLTALVYGNAGGAQTITASPVSFSSTLLCQPLAVDEPAFGDVNVYPNPATDQLTFSFSIAPQSIVIYDLSGKKMETQQLSGQEKNFSIDISHFDAGIYFWQMQLKDGSLQSGRFCVLHQ